MNIVVVRARLRLDRKGHLHLGHTFRERSDPKVIGRWMRRLRRRRGVTLSGVAAYIGCTTAAIRRLERGDIPPSGWTVLLYLKMAGYELVLVEIA